MVKGAKALEVWCRRLTTGYSDVEVSNMSSSWRDGLAFCALVHAFRPDLFDFDALDRRQVASNCELAFSLAEIHLGVPQLLDAEDMVRCVIPDRLSILTYVSEFYHKCKHLTPSSSPSSLALPSKPRQMSLDSTGCVLSRTPSSSSSTCEITSSGSSEPESENERHKCRRMARSMYLLDVASSSAMGSLVGSDTDPEFERENPFREAMILFMEQQREKTQGDSGQQSEDRQCNSKKKSEAKMNNNDVSVFLNVASPQSTGSVSPKSPSLSFTSSPRPYSGQMMRAVSVGNGLNKADQQPQQLRLLPEPKMAFRKGGNFERRVQNIAPMPFRSSLV